MKIIFEVNEGNDEATVEVDLNKEKETKNLIGGGRREKDPQLQMRRAI